MTWDGKETIAATCNWGRGDLGVVVLPLQESKWSFSRGH